MTRQLLISSFLLLSCDLPSKKGGLVKPSPNVTPAVIVDIPVDSAGDTDYYYLKHKQISRELGLPDISENRKDLEVRIWTSSQLTVEGDHYIVLRRQNDNLNGELWNLELQSTAITNGEREVIAKERKRFNPQPAWASLYNRLNKLNLLTLPDCSQIKGYGYGVDGSVYLVEVSTPAMYRFYGYWTPQHFRSRFWQADNMMKMLELLERELHVDL